MTFIRIMPLAAIVLCTGCEVALDHTVKADGSVRSSMTIELDPKNGATVNKEWVKQQGKQKDPTDRRFRLPKANGQTAMNTSPFQRTSAA